jgi:hypothetical protein
MGRREDEIGRMMRKRSQELLVLMVANTGLFSGLA